MSRFQAIKAFARAPPADVPTRRMSFSAFSRPAPAKLPWKPPRWVSTSDARLTSVSISILFALRGFGPIAGKNSSAPIPREPV